MIHPPAYPRIPYLWDGADGAQNLVPPGQVEDWLQSPVLVEEKLDGANVSLYLDEGVLRVASRGGPEAMDRAGQLGRLRAWAAERHEAFVRLLGADVVLYGEWLWLTHSVHYERLPDWLVTLDLWSSTSGWLDTQARDRVAAAAGLPTPPQLFAGVPGSREQILGLIGRSTFGDEPAEGVVLRRDDGQRCKVVRPGFQRLGDAQWKVGRRNNSLARPTS